MANLAILLALKAKPTLVPSMDLEMSILDP